MPGIWGDMGVGHGEKRRAPLFLTSPFFLLKSVCSVLRLDSAACPRPLGSPHEAPIPQFAKPMDRESSFYSTSQKSRLSPFFLTQKCNHDFSVHTNVAEQGIPRFPLTKQPHRKLRPKSPHYIPTALTPAPDKMHPKVPPKKH